MLRQAFVEFGINFENLTSTFIIHSSFHCNWSWLHIHDVSEIRFLNNDKLNRLNFKVPREFLFLSLHDFSHFFLSNVDLVTF